MRSGARDEAVGQWHKVKGKIKEIVGKLTDDPKLEAEGTTETIAGKVQVKFGQIKAIVGK
jgi:uncharacterized protein YjbJ (UPF0337 family)